MSICNLRASQAPVIYAAPLLIVVCGCGGAYDATVAGSVSLDGAPLTRGTVAFHPSIAGPPAYGRIDEAGNYAVRTGREMGLPSGDYKITVIANEPPEKSTSASGGPPPPGKPIAPLWYKTTKTSPLQFAVQPGSNTYAIELSSNPPSDWKPPRPNRRR